MAISTIELTNFRSYRQQQFEFNPHLSLIVGPNGSGKTNLLESVYVLARGRSWRARDPELVTHGEEFYRLHSPQQNLELRYRMQPSGSRRTKTYLYNQKPLRWLDYHDQLPVVLFEPTTMDIVTGGPEGRRTFLDAVLVASNRQYLKHLLAYRKILKQRNALLKSGNLALARQQIFAWDIKLVEQADYLVKQRSQFVKFLNRYSSSYYQQISQDAVTINFELENSYHSKQYASTLMAELEASLARDHRFGTTGSGPHRDDLLISFNNRIIQSLASRGEQRTLLLIAKLIELKYLSQHTKVKPVLLFDDVFSELDQLRSNTLAKALTQHQSMITTTSLTGIDLKTLPQHSLIKLG